MALENFNVFGMIFITKDKIKITATAFNGKKSKSSSNTFREQSEKLAGLVIPFSARVGKSDIPLLFGERAIKIETEQVVNSTLYLDELRLLEAKLLKFLSFFE
ncbi:MAG: hypothetical protein PHQ36_07575 [Anaerolineales bacterium]|nr:hypothetical protein [Anaerolineales bacterium]